MLQTRGTHITMHEGDYGLPLPFRVIGGDFLPTDKIRFSIKRNEGEILHKDYAQGDIADGVFILSFTQDEAAKLTPGHYLWYMTLLRDDVKEGPQENTIKGPCTMEVFDNGV